MDIRQYIEMGIPIPIGVSGENNIESFKFGYGDWVSLYGDGVLSINHQRPGDEYPYPCTITTEDYIATWEISATDTQYSGQGRIQVVYMVNGIVKKTMIGNTLIESSLGENVAAVDPIASYIDTMVEIKNDTYQYKLEAKASADTASQKAQDVLGLTADATVNNNVGTPSVDVAVTQDGDHKKLSFAFENLKGDTGEQGEKGDTGVPYVKTVKGKKIIISNAMNDEGTILSSGTHIYSANNTKNVIKQTAKVTSYGYTFQNNANNGVTIKGTATTSSLINRYWADGAYTQANAGKKVFMTGTGSAVYLTAFLIPRTMTGMSEIRVNFHTGSTVAKRLYLNSTTRFATEEVTVSSGTSVYLSISDTAATPSGTTKVLDVDLYVFVSSSQGDAVNTNIDDAIKLYENKDTIIVSDGIAQIRYAYIPMLEGVGKEFEVCQYNVGHFAYGDSTPVGTDATYAEFINTFNDAKGSIFTFSEWDKYWNESGNIESKTRFGALRQYWSTSDEKETNGYILQKTASQYRILYEDIYYYVNYYSTATNNYFLDCVINTEDGDNIHVLNTQLTWRSAATRRAQIQEIITYLANNGIDYAIIAGDFNHGTSEDDDPATSWAEFEAYILAELKLWSDNGYKSLQGWVIGDITHDLLIQTMQTTSEIRVVKPYDNIVVTPNMSFLCANTLTNEESDHKAIWATIAIN